MQLFTMAWWQGYGDSRDATPVNAYWQHITRLKSALPPEVTAFLDEHTLHDSNLVQLRPSPHICLPVMTLL
jgi:hypothetical protein